MASLNLFMATGAVIDSPKGMTDAVKFRFLNIEKTKDYEDRCEVDVVTFGSLGAICAGLKQGDRIFLEGSIHNKSRELPSGKKHFYTEIHARKIDIISIVPRVDEIQKEKDWDIE